MAYRIGGTTSHDVIDTLGGHKPNDGGRHAWLTQWISDTRYDVYYVKNAANCPAAPDPERPVCLASVTTDAYAANTLDYFGKAYATEITAWGYRYPATSAKAKYQVYIHDLGGANAVTWDPVLGPNGSSSTITIKAALTDEYLLGVVGHEYHHASQFMAMLDQPGNWSDAK